MVDLHFCWPMTPTNNNMRIKVEMGKPRKLKKIPYPNRIPKTERTFAHLISSKIPSALLPFAVRNRLLMHMKIDIRASREAIPKGRKPGPGLWVL